MHDSFLYIYFNSFPTGKRNGHQRTVTYTRCCIDTIDCPDVEHGVARKHVQKWNKYTGCFTTCGYYCRRCFLGLCDQKSSYKHVSDFGRLRSYGHFLIPVHALVWTASYGTSWRVMHSAWWLIVCGSCDEQLAQIATERQPVLRPAVAFSKTSFKHR